MNLSPYKSYKATGVDLFPDSPPHWEVARVANICTFDKGFGLSKSDLTEDGKHSCILYGELFTKYKHEIILLDVTSRTSTPSGKLSCGDEILIPASTTTTGIDLANAKHLPHKNVLLGGDIIILKPRIAYDQKYICYFLSEVNKREFIRQSRGVTIFHIYSTAIRDMPLLLPPLIEQTQIAAFLDREIAKIDRLIEKQERLIELLEEKRQAVISHAVTKGLNPDTPMKDSGVQYLGEVPAHWTMRRLKHISPKIGVGLVINPSTYTRDEGPHFIFGGNVKPYGFKLENSRKISEEDSIKLHQSRLETNDIVTVRVGAPGVTAVVDQSLNGSNCASVMIVRRGDFNSDWLCACMNSPAGMAQVKRVEYGAAQKQFNISDAIEFVFPTPPKHEQDEISKYVGVMLNKFDKLMTTASRQIQLLKERRSALISAAVTGKIDVRDQVPQDVEEAVAS